MFPPVQTGTSFYTQNLAEALVKLNHHLRVVTVKNRESVDDQYSFEVERLKALHLPLKNYFKHLRICSIYPKNYRRLDKIVQKDKPDVILLINHYLDIAFLAIYLAKKYKIPLVISVGTYLESLNPIRHKILNILDRIICGGLIFSNCQRIIAWDKEIKRYLTNIQGIKIIKKIVIVPYGVHDEKIINKYRHNYQKIDQIIGVGAIIEQRNFLFLIRLFKELLLFYPDLKLKIIGHIYYDASVKLAQKLNISKKVIFTGEISHSKVLAELKNSTIFWGLSSGRYTGLGTAVIEAMLLGLPVISDAPTDLFGRPTLIDMENIIFSSNSSVDKTSAKIKLILSDWRLRKKIGQNGRKFVQKYMSWDKIAKDMTKVFEEVIKS